MSRPFDRKLTAGSPLMVTIGTPALKSERSADKRQMTAIDLNELQIKLEATNNDMTTIRTVIYKTTFYSW